MGDQRKGRQSPTVGKTLPYTTTKGSEAIDLYNSTGRIAQEWQASLIYDIMATDDDGKWVHTRWGFSVPRQNGKNECLSIREMWGLMHGERILHTAHRTATSRSAWERLVMLVEKTGILEIKGKNRSGFRTGKSKGQEWIEMDGTHGGGKVSFRTRSTTGGLGETFDLLVIDEAQEYQLDQESALKYTIVSSQNPQTIYLGTPPTPYSSGTIFPDYRKDVLLGNKTRAGWAEWSVEEPTDMHDREAWYETNPSLGTTITESAIEDEIGSDKDDFNIQRLGLWISYSQSSAISKSDWESCRVSKLPPICGKMTVGIKFAKSGISASLAVAVNIKDSQAVFVEAYGCHQMRDGIDWIVEFCRRTQESTSKIIVDGANGIEMLNTAFKDSGLKPPTVCTYSDMVAACAWFEMAVTSTKAIQHMEQPSADRVITACDKRPIGSSGGFGYKAQNMAHDISIMDAMIMAAWLKSSEKPLKKQRVSY